MSHHQRRCRTELHAEVAIAHGIETVGVDRIETQLCRRPTAVDRHRRTGKGSSPEGGDVDPTSHILQTVPVTLQHLDVSQQMVSQAERLSPLQMGVARDQSASVLIRLGPESPLQSNQIGVKTVQATA